MDKRIHTKHSPNLTYRHYLVHFKWPLLGLLTLFLLLAFTQLNFISDFLEGEDFEISFTDVIYPIDLSKKHDLSYSIEYYFIRKDQLKSNDDAKSIDQKQKVMLPLMRNTSSSNSYLILEFTNVFFHPRFCSHSKKEIFGPTCPYTNCEYTCNLTREKEANVLLMHKRDLKPSQLETMKRNSEQIWLLWHDESNENTPEINKYKFNWTITYRISAEASLGAYGITIMKNKPWSTRKFKSWVDEQFDKRDNQAVWFVSNCKPQKRLRKFRSFRKYFPIVAFGKCISSNETFSLNARIHSQDQCGRKSSCEEVYLTTSKFYLAFESQTCTDYVTEKFWRTLAAGAIPIVSGPEREDFARIAPPNSFIHVNDYTSDRELAEALNSIGRNRSLYGKYQRWRQYYDVYSEAQEVDPYRFCELCYRLNTNKQRIWYENVNDWFLEKC